MDFYIFSDFPNRLRALRMERDLSVQQLSEKIGCARTTMYNFETGRRVPSLELLVELADFFDVSVDYLIGRTDDPVLHQKED